MWRILSADRRRAGNRPNNMESHLNIWLVGLSVDVDVYYLISASDLVQAEAGVLEMGRTWWPSLQREDDRHRWEYPEGVI